VWVCGDEVWGLGPESVAEAWGVLPPERTIFHVATAGVRDDSWTEPEVAAFRPFIERCARVLAPGSGVAERET